MHSCWDKLLVTFAGMVGLVAEMDSGCRHGRSCITVRGGKYGNIHAVVWNVRVESEERNKGPCRNADEDDAHHGSRLKQSAGEGLQEQRRTEGEGVSPMSKGTFAGWQ